jgi:hypothetical protein
MSVRTNNNSYIVVVGMAICGGAGYVSSGSERLMKELETHKEIT